MMYYIVSVLFSMSVWCPCMAINVSVYVYSIITNGGLLPDIPSGKNPFKCHEEVLYLQPMILPKRFDMFPP